MGASETPQGWDDILFPGEKVLWQGQPDPTPDWRAWRPGKNLVGLFFAAFAVLWMTLAAQAAPGGGLIGWIFPLFGLPFLAIGLSRGGGQILVDAYRRRGTWYTLTNKRAFIATQIFGRRDLEAYPISPGTRVEHEDGRHIWFATDVVTTKTGTRRERVGFTHLRDSREVMDAFMALQRENT